MDITLILSRVCACCKRELSSAEFYFNHRKQVFDKYCKECRKKRSRQQRKTDSPTRKAKNYLIITEVEDKELRMKLIYQVRNTIQASVQRKREKQKYDEYRSFKDDCLY